MKEVAAFAKDAAQHFRDGEDVFYEITWFFVRRNYQVFCYSVYNSVYKLEAARLGLHEYKRAGRHGARRKEDASTWMNTRGE